MLNIHAQKYRCDPCKVFCANFKKKPFRVARAAIKLKISGQAMGRIVKLSYWLSGYYNK
jgi:hypothetical protein